VERIIKLFSISYIFSAGKHNPVQLIKKKKQDRKHNKKQQELSRDTRPRVKDINVRRREEFRGLLYCRDRKPSIFFSLGQTIERGSMVSKHIPSIGLLTLKCLGLSRKPSSGPLCSWEKLLHT
jgi:hypothetical protein